MQFFYKKVKAGCLIYENIVYFCTSQAQMAELVDALVSNTSGFTSMPVRSRLWVLEKPNGLSIRLFYLLVELLFVVQLYVCHRIY